MQKNPGTWAERTVAPENHVVKIPDDFWFDKAPEAGLDFVQAAAVPMGAYIAGDLWRRAQKLLAQKNSRCLIVGASGGLGTFLLQILKRNNEERAQKQQEQKIHVVAVCSGSNAETVKRLGAQEVVDYKLGGFGEQLSNTNTNNGAEKFDVVFDFVGGKDTEREAAKILRKGGKFITAVGPAKAVGDKVFTCCEFWGWAGGLTRRLLKSACCPCMVSFSYEMGGGMPPVSQKTFDETVVSSGARAEIAGGKAVPFSDEAALRAALRRVASRHPGGGRVVISMEG
jgi:hypothetical protein